MFLPYVSKINSAEPKLMSCAHSVKKNVKNEGKKGGDWVKIEFFMYLLFTLWFYD